MSKDSTTFGASPKRIAELLDIGVELEELSEEAKAETMAELLRARFAGPLPLETAVVEALPTVIGKLCHNLLPLGGKPLKEVLLSNKTDICVIKRVKEYGKKLAGQADPHHTVGIAVYYTAIASAVLFHDEKITQHSYKYVADSLDEITKDWMPTELAHHLSRASEACRQLVEK